jgi:hypothetical protein
VLPDFIFDIKFNIENNKMAFDLSVRLSHSSYFRNKRFSRTEIDLAGPIGTSIIEPPTAYANA